MVITRMKKALAEPPNFGDMVHRRLSGMFESAIADCGMEGIRQRELWGRRSHEINTERQIWHVFHMQYVAALLETNNAWTMDSCRMSI